MRRNGASAEGDNHLGTGDRRSDTGRILQAPPQEGEGRGKGGAVGEVCPAEVNMSLVASILARRVSKGVLKAEQGGILMISGRAPRTMHMRRILLMKT